MKRFLLLSMLGVTSCDDAPPSLTFEEACERLVAQCNVPPGNLGTCKNHGWDVTEAAQEAGCEEDLDAFLECANDSDLFCGVFSGSDCQAQADVLAACGAPVF